MSRRALIAIFLSMSMPGCSLLPTFRGPAPALSAPLDSPWPDGLQDYRGVIHCHSEFSHDSRGTLEEIQRACANIGLDFLIMTDHITEDSVAHGWRGLQGNTLFMVGAEISRPQGSVLALDLDRYIDPRTSTPEVLEAIHAQGGLAILGHMERVSAGYENGFDGLELFNIHANAQLHSKAGLVLKALFLPPGSLFRSMTAVHPPNFARWDELTQTHPMVGVFGNDVHQNITLLGPNLGHVGTYEQLLKVAVTRVIAPRCDRESVMEALRAGRCYGALEIWGDAKGFLFAAKRGERTLLPGDRARYEPGWTLQVRLPVQAEIRLIRNGVEIERIECRAWTKDLRRCGIYRVEAWLDGKPWIFANPIYLHE